MYSCKQLQAQKGHLDSGLRFRKTSYPYYGRRGLSQASKDQYLVHTPFKHDNVICRRKKEKLLSL